MGVNKELEPTLIAFVKHNRLQFSVNAFKEIVQSAGSRPVSIVSFNYPNDGQRQEILNESLNYLKTVSIDRDARDGYAWKSRSDTDAKGIYLWPEPIVIKKSCQEVAVFVMETNGTIEESMATREDLMLFALTCVLSSTVVYSIPKKWTENFLEFLQLFDKYMRGGVGMDLTESHINLILMVRDYKRTNLSPYQYGYHDISTCPPVGDKMYNYRKKVSLSGDSEFAFRHNFFVESFAKISFCLIPGTEFDAIDFNVKVPTFGDVVRQLMGRIFHPSNASVKRFGDKKVVGFQMASLFEKIAEFVAESDPELKGEFGARLRDTMALSNGLNYYRFKMDRLIDDDKFVKDEDLMAIQEQCRAEAIKLFETVRGVAGLDQNRNQREMRDKYYDMFDKELQRFRAFNEELNAFKFESLRAKQITQKLMDEMAERVRQMKREFNGQPTCLETEISQLIGISLGGLTSAVRTAVN